eukprot:TRINITY_DN7854_c0_g1_i1.p1 TRINITY_DN7854_c0_g1~~TRINITY_DN7854_c0_g1_i1.p1  ORF type:complete len:247 (+),score=98.84 TRINITY_DN7854_c0_g1_i1:56-742(+)
MEQLKNRNIKGIIFDCDGVLVDSEPLSCYSLNVLFNRHFNTEIGTNYDSVLGKSTIDAITILCQLNNIEPLPSKEVIEKLSIEKEEIYFELTLNNLKTFPNLIKVLEFAQTKNLKLAVASSGALKKINFSLTQTQLTSYFPVITSVEEVQRGKPHPDVFQEAARRINLAPEECIVIEDSISGIKAALASGSFAIGLATTFSIDKLIEAGAIIVVSDYEQLLSYFIEFI